MASPELLFRGARVVDPRAGRDEVADVHVRDGLVAEVGSGLGGASAEVVDCDGLVLAPGLVDLHTHLREPGLRAQGDGRDRERGRPRPAGTRRSRRWPTPIRSPTTLA